jgi:hypothetical protein
MREDEDESLGFLDRGDLASPFIAPGAICVDGERR